MEREKQVYHVKLDSSGRLLIPSELRERHRIANGDTLRKLNRRTRSLSEDHREIARTHDRIDDLKLRR